MPNGDDHEGMTIEEWVKYYKGKEREANRLFVENKKLRDQIKGLKRECCRVEGGRGVKGPPRVPYCNKGGL